MTDRIALAARTWDNYRSTNALLAVDLHAEVASEGPLAGLAFSVKDVFDTAGLASTGGSLLFEGRVPPTDAVAVDRLRRAGATLFAKGNCAEFGIGLHTETRLGGRVLHPTDEHRSTGGSSGGDAVAVATGIVDFALAGDYGGSVRWPAQAVGVHGLRTSVGLVPRTGRIPGSGATLACPTPAPPDMTSLQGRLEVIGLFASTPGLLSRVLTVIAGPDGQDWAGRSGPGPAGPRTGRVAVTTGREIAPVADDVVAALGVATAAARSSGYEIVDAHGILQDAVDLYARLRATLDDLVDLRRLSAGHEDRLCPGTQRALAAAPGPGGETLALDQARAATVVDRVVALLTTVDALLLPVAPVAATGPDGGARVAGRWLDDVELMAHCRAVSLTGLPALSMPVGTGPNGPVSVQVVGAPGGDWTCCELAGELARHIDTRHNDTRHNDIRWDGTPR
jgi:amidase